MTKTVGIWVLFFTFCLSNIYGQLSAFDNGKIINSKNPYREYMFIHNNASVLLTGEYLYYSVYSINAKTRELSTFSKIGYVELVGEDANVIFRHKIKLTNGLGQGEFFIPVTVPSGNYMLIGYTQWMKNNEKNYFFQSDIGIINPFQNNQGPIVKLSKASGIKVPNDKTKTRFKGIQEETEIFKLGINKKIFKKREQGVLTINALSENGTRGNYSISIRKVDSIGESLRPTAREHVFAHKTQSSKEIDTIGRQKHLPELRGELISGRIIPKDSNFSATEEKLAFSIPGKQFMLKLTKTDKQGRFYFNINESYKKGSALVQILGENRDKYKIEFSEQRPVNYENLEFNTLTITPEMENLILKRSIHNQIENAFVEVRPDTIKQTESILPIYRRFSQVYDLDDYTRFSTIRETVSEVIEHVWIKKGMDGEDIFQVRGYENHIASNFLPLVLVDGILIQHHSDVIDLDARNIKRINVSRKECVINSVIYKGIIAMETIRDDFSKSFRKDYIKLMELFPPLPAKNYFDQKYDATAKSTTVQIPDFRQQLMWLPNLEMTSLKFTTDFYTSDIGGNYEIYLEGFTVDGKPVSIKETFKVE
jgi:hypothetical protein